VSFETLVDKQTTEFMRNTFYKTASIGNPFMSNAGFGMNATTHSGFSNFKIDKQQNSPFNFGPNEHG
jgi:hypothetical protein